MEFVTFLSDHPQYTAAIITLMMEAAPVIDFFIPGTFIQNIVRLLSPVL